MTEQIPGPAGWPFIGNLLDVQGEVPIQAIEHIADIYGPIIKLSLAGNERLFVGGFDIFDELCDETRFYKLPPPALTQNARPGARGLFTSPSEKDADWGQAHRILMPAFGPLAIQNMFDEMYDIATQMVMKWARLGPEPRVLLTEDFTRLTLDTIALCAMDYRFNSFYSDTVHPYVQAMTNTLAARSQSGQIGQKIKMLLQPSYAASLKADVAYMGTVGRDLVQHRRDNPTDKKDLLNNMVHGRDPKTGESMRDELIAANMQTFLVAGHETTSGLLSFAFMYLLLNPTTFFAAQQEVDRVLGTRRIEPHVLNELPYLNAVLRETLRLSPTAPGFARGVRPENKEEHVTVAGGKYEIPRGAPVLCLLGKIQRDPKVWGDDADQFRPERMLDENFAKLPKNAWKPFGTGLRACIGRAFAWQEALLVTALLLQNFTISLADPNYQMQVQQTLTIKPKNTYVHVKLRQGIDATQLLQRLTGRPAAPPRSVNGPSSAQATNGINGTNGTIDGATTADGPTLAILYGSNTGTCQSLAQSLAVEAGQRGYRATVHDLDSAVEHVPKGPNTTVVIITASYEGQPPDNAARFFAWLERVEAKDALDGARFAVFGCGHVDWASTYQRIPTRIDALLEENGATRVAERGASDASQRDMFGDFAKWTDNVLWKALPSAEDAATAMGDKKVHIPTIDMDVSTEQRETHLQQKLFWAKVTAARSLTAPGQPEKRHIEFQLPSDMTYQTGDYLAVLPLNPDDVVRRVIQRFRQPWDAVVTIKRGAPTTLPTDTPIALAELLRGYVELALPATRKDIEVLLELAKHGEGVDARTEANKLAALLDDPSAFGTTVIEHRTSLLDLLEQNPSVGLPLASFLAMLPPLRARHYSIASSPLASPDSCALCYSVIDEPTWVADAHGRGASPDKAATPPRMFRGVTGTYLKSLQPGDQALVAVRATNHVFRLPADRETTPLLMFCAGSGFAPFRGFLQERAVQIRDGNRSLAPAVLFVGCRRPDADRLYADEVDAWVRDGVVDVRYAFSQAPTDPRAAGCRYVPDRLLHDKDIVVAQWKAGAKVYTCGSGQVAKDLGAAARKLIVERAREGVAAGEEGVVGMTEEDAAAWMQQRHNERFVTDVFT
ncbi:hypothetical protein HMPREF1624_05118 [Sporothrix schenckii ATCC 58251]|uniref:Bifunctional cytochrome P450/NADPH--P450 reductase n=1 Tax=Sporothrix schenckii (strain ATCC 58251 / de Perez 2211183) TaxID=1391915 RepID=U7PUA1_SPOS1|nr:hypothetical protein HMPREF1624_05118 [Sporothrix schenckii ATCC 58251]